MLHGKATATPLTGAPGRGPTWRQRGPAPRAGRETRGAGNRESRDGGGGAGRRGAAAAHTGTRGHTGVGGCERPSSALVVWGRAGASLPAPALVPAEAEGGGSLHSRVPVPGGGGGQGRAVQQTEHRGHLRDHLPAVRYSWVTWCCLGYLELPRVTWVTAAFHVCSGAIAGDAGLQK